MAKTLKDDPDFNEGLDTEKTEAVINKTEKKVKVRITEEVDCIIAGISYKFKKDSEASVATDVAAILCYAKKAYRL